MNSVSTSHPEVDTLLDELCSGIGSILGERLAGLYLAGSLVTGDFDPRVSDVDLVAILHAPLDEAAFNGLHHLHERIAAHFPAWRDRVEVVYVSAAALQTFRTQSSELAVISPGEPFHYKEAGREWLVNWWVVRGQGVALYGPPAATWITPITDEEFLQCVREHAEQWRDWVYEMGHRGGQAYTILTLCRALYSVSNKEQPSKRRAAEWAQARYPEWASLIELALAWRMEPQAGAADGAATLGETVRFVNFAADRIAEGAP